MPLPRRMFAGERVRYHRPLRLGEAARREIELADMSVKRGGTGTLVFATVVSRIYGEGGGASSGDGLAIEEERRTVFREEVKAGERNQAPRREEAPRDAPWRRTVSPDAVVLFRFSALTFNSHRIHYDRTWAMQVEGYPGLVVHGPFTATQLADFARDHAAGRAMVSFTAQARAPLFDTHPSSSAAARRPTGAARSSGRSRPRARSPSAPRSSWPNPDCPRQSHERAGRAPGGAARGHPAPSGVSKGTGGPAPPRPALGPDPPRA